MAHRLALGADSTLFGAEVAVGIDLNLDAAIAVDGLTDHRDHVDPVDLAGDDKGGGLVVGVGRPGADGGDEVGVARHHIAVPVAVFEEFHKLLLAIPGLLDDHQGIDAHQVAAFVGVAVAGAGTAVGDVAEDRAGVTADFGGGGAGVRHLKPPLLSKSLRAPVPAWRAAA